jgi:hypothetical protein
VRAALTEAQVSSGASGMRPEPLLGHFPVRA